jgi:hypothetical protein
MKENTYLVSFTLEETRYMNETKKTEMLQLVVAESEEEAGEKVGYYYDKKSTDYGVYYFANINYVAETIK